MNSIHIGQHVQNTIGHWYVVLAILSPLTYRVQPLTPCGDTLVPLGGPVRMGRYEMKGV